MAFARDLFDFTIGGAEPSAVTSVVGGCGVLPAVAGVAGRVPLRGRPVDARAVEAVRVVEAPGERVADVAFRPDGAVVVGAFSDGIVRYWDAGTFAEVGSFSTGRGIHAVAFSPDGKALVVAGEAPDPVRVWDVASCVEVGALAGEADVYDVAYSPDGSRIATADYEGRVQLWDAATRAPMGAPLELFTEYAGAVDFSADGTRLAVAGGDTDRGVYAGGVVVIDVATQAVHHRFDVADYHVRSVAFSPDGRTVVSGDYGNAVRLWDVEGKTQVGSGLTGHVEAARAVDYSPDGRTLASGSGDDERPVGTDPDTSVRLWDARANRAAGSIGATSGAPVMAVAFSPDGALLVSGSIDGAVRVWRVG